MFWSNIHHWVNWQTIRQLQRGGDDACMRWLPPNFISTLHHWVLEQVEGNDGGQVRTAAAAAAAAQAESDFSLLLTDLCFCFSHQFETVWCLFHTCHRLWCCRETGLPVTSLLLLFLPLPLSFCSYHTFTFSATFHLLPSHYCYYCKPHTHTRARKHI